MAMLHGVFRRRLPLDGSFPQATAPRTCCLRRSRAIPNAGLPQTPFLSQSSVGGTAFNASPSCGLVARDDRLIGAAGRGAVRIGQADILDRRGNTDPLALERVP